jgi:hypothetical protein
VVCLPDSGHGCACESGANDEQTTETDHSPAFKAIEEQFDVHPNQVTTWKTQLEGAAADVFDGGNGSTPAAPAVDVKQLHAKIGELTLENDS